MAEKSAKAKKNIFARIGAWFKRVGKYFRDTGSEMKKVVWPSRKQVWNNFVVVLVVVVIAALVIFGLDVLFKFLLQLLIGTGA